MALPRLIRKRVSQAQAKSGYRRGLSQKPRRNAHQSSGGTVGTCQHRVAAQRRVGHPGDKHEHRAHQVPAEGRAEQLDAGDRETGADHHAHDLSDAEVAARRPALRHRHLVGDGRRKGGVGRVEHRLDQAPAGDEQQHRRRRAEQQQAGGAETRCRRRPRGCACRNVRRSGRTAPPTTGLATIEKAAPTPATRASRFSLPPGEIASACRASRICSGPYQPTKVAATASAKNATHLGGTFADRFGGRVGRAAGGGPVSGLPPTNRKSRRSFPGRRPCVNNRLGHLQEAGAHAPHTTEDQRDQNQHHHNPGEHPRGLAAPRACRLVGEAAMPATAPPGDRNVLFSSHGTSRGACDGGTSSYSGEVSGSSSLHGSHRRTEGASTDVQTWARLASWKSPFPRAVRGGPGDLGTGRQVGCHPRPRHGCRALQRFRRHRDHSGTPLWTDRLDRLAAGAAPRVPADQAGGDRNRAVPAAGGLGRGPRDGAPVRAGRK